MSKPKDIFDVFFNPSSQTSGNANSLLNKQVISDKLKKTNIFTKEEKYLIEQALIAFKG